MVFRKTDFKCPKCGQSTLALYAEFRGVKSNQYTIGIWCAECKEDPKTLAKPYIGEIRGRFEPGDELLEKLSEEESEKLELETKTT